MSSPPSSAAPLQPGDLLAGRYRLVRLLGEGGMGVVWEGCHVTTDKRVAIKVLKGRDGADTARFLREAKIAAGLTHRNIVQVFDFWDVEGGGPLFMVMELLLGETLADHLERVGRLAVEDARAILLPVASALRVAHGQGIVHRDLKPDNIFLARTSDGDPVEVKVLDFGLARQVSPDALTTAITRTGSVMGTPFYMAPEQLYGEKEIDVRADVWAFGIVLYECLTGARPFGGDNFGQLVRRVTQATFQPLRDLAPGAPLSLENLVGRMLSQDPARRPTIAEVCSSLAEGIGPDPLRVPEPLVREEGHPRAQATPPTVLATATSVSRGEPVPRRSLGVVFGLVGLIAAGGGLAAVLRAKAAPSTSGAPPDAATAAAPVTLPLTAPAKVAAPAPETTADSGTTDAARDAPLPVLPARPKAERSKSGRSKPTDAGPPPSATAAVGPPDPLGEGRF